MCIGILQGKEMITISKTEYQELLSFRSLLQEQQSEVELLKHQHTELKRLIYGSKRERFIAPDPLQSSLFNSPEAESKERKIEEITFTRTKPEPDEKKHPLHAELSSHLPRQDEVLETENLPEGAKKIGKP